MSALVINGGLVHYEAIGRGKPLVFLHGWIGSWRYWVPAMEQLSTNHRAYAIDLWGFGDSDKSSEWYNFDTYVDLLARFTDRLGVDKISVVGHTLGGLVAVRFAGRHPGRVTRIMGVGVPLDGTAVGRHLHARLGNGDGLARLACRRVSFPELETESRKTDSLAVSSTLQSAMEEDLRDAMLTLKIPILLVYGSNDPLIKVPAVDWSQQNGNNLRVMVLDDTQHFPMLEDQNKFNRLLKDFLGAGDDLSSLAVKQEWQRRVR
jgi:pimeloyl-ACP methyl ester carboxylesterase